MAINRLFNIPSTGQALGIFRTSRGEIVNIFAASPWYRFFSDVDRLHGELVKLRNEFDQHVTDTSAHGATGDIVGDQDDASVADKGVVNQATDPGNSAAATVPALVADYNTLLANLRTAGML